MGPRAQALIPGLLSLMPPLSKSRCYTIVNFGFKDWKPLDTTIRLAKEADLLLCLQTKRTHLLIWRIYFFFLFFPLCVFVCVFVLFYLFI